MNKYIPAEKLTAEIERLKDEYTDIAIDSRYGTVNANSVVGDLEQLLSLIDSLQQEQPEADLEKEIDHFEDWMETYNQSDYPTCISTRQIARHFAEWGAIHLNARKDE